MLHIMYDLVPSFNTLENAMTVDDVDTLLEKAAVLTTHKTQLEEIKKLKADLAKKIAALPTDLVNLFPNNGQQTSRKRAERMDPNEVDSQVLGAFKGDKQLKKKDICKATNLDVSRVQLALKRLVDGGKLKKHSPDGSTVNTTYAKKQG